MARRRVVLMASGMAILVAAFGTLAPWLAVWMHVSVPSVVLTLMALEIVAFTLVVRSLVHLKQDEARERLEDGKV